MFTGIIEAIGTVEKIEKEGSNVHLTLTSPFVSELKVDQSLAHNGVCLTVVNFPNENTYTVTAIKETLDNTNLGNLQEGSPVNLERCLEAGHRLDGHIVQGHVDLVGRVSEIKEEKGSWYFYIEYPKDTEHFTVPKGSITINGTSLTVVDSEPGMLSVAIIPFTYENTLFKHYKVGDAVNLEFDVIGKYVQRLVGPYKNN